MSTSGKRIKLISALGCAAVAVTVVFVASRTTAPVRAQAPAGTISLAGQASAQVQGRMVTPEESDTPFVISASTRAAAERHMEFSEEAMAARAASLPRSAAAPLAPPQLAGATSTIAPDPDAAVPPGAPSTYTQHKVAVINGAPISPPGFGVSSVAEPSVAVAGKYLFMTWNWGAARSTNNATGATPWKYINPTTSPSFPDFCCDQDVIYDKGRDIMIWERMGVPTTLSGLAQNRILIGASKNGGGSFCTYDIRPSQTAWPAGGVWLDYPRLALSNNYLYMTTNVFTTAGAFVAHQWARFPLDTLRACSALTYNYWVLAAGWSPASIENATETMYFGDQIAAAPVTSTFRVYWQDEANTTLNWVDRAITGFLFTNRGDAFCPVAGGANPCARADMRVTSGTLADRQLDFYWNVQEGSGPGGGFAFPYVESAGFDQNTLTYNARKLVWNGGYSWFYAAVAANARHHVGMSVFQFAPGANPVHWSAIDDDYNAAPPGWEVGAPLGSTGAWTANQAGDYLRIRSGGPQDVMWSASGYLRNAAAGSYLPHYMVFGRGRDVPGEVRFEKK